MAYRNSKSGRNKTSATWHAVVETLESRQLLSLVIPHPPLIPDLYQAVQDTHLVSAAPRVRATAPATPTSVVATVKSPTLIQLTWKAATTGIAGFYIQRSTNNGDFVQIAKLTSGLTLSYNDATVLSSNSYSYRVIAYNSTLSSLYAQSASVTTPLITPTALTATALDRTSIRLQWINKDTSATGYHVLRSDNGGTTYTQIADVTDVSTTSYTDTKVLSGHAYRYQVHAYNTLTSSANTPAASVSTPLAAPSDLAPQVNAPTKVTLSWTNNDTSTTGYVILRSFDGKTFTTLATFSGASTTTYVDTSARSGNLNYYQVKALCGTIASPVSGTATADTPLGASTGLIATALRPTAVKITWTRNDPNAVGYYILRSTSGGDFTQIAQITVASALTYTDSTTTSNTAYQYKVQAYNARKSADASAAASVITPLVAPSALTAIATDRTVVQLSWTDNDSSATGYHVLRSGDGGKTYTQIADLTDAGTASYTDSTALSGHAYLYRVHAYNSDVSSANAQSAVVNTPLAAPSALTTTVKGPQTVALAWTNNDPYTAGYRVLRSRDGITYTTIATLTSALAVTYTDGLAISGGTSYYKIQAIAGNSVSPTTDAAQVTTPLAACAVLTATATSATSVQLKWIKDDPNATGYYILRSDNGGDFAQIAEIKVASALAYTDTTASSFTSYQYKVQAYNANMQADPSNIASVQTTLLSPAGLTATATSKTSIALSWTNRDSATLGYYLLRSIDGKTFNRLATLSNADTTTYTDNAVFSGTRYTYAVQAFNGSYISAASTAAAATTPVGPAANLQAAVLSGTSVKLTWSDSDPTVTGYLIQRSENGGSSYLGIATLAIPTAVTYTDTKAASGHSYIYRVLAYKGSAYSEGCISSAVITPLAKPAATATTSGLSVTLTWTGQDANATGYYVLRSTDNSSFDRIATVSGSAAKTYTDNAVDGGKTYYYQVQAFNAVTSSDPSAAVTALPTGTNVTFNTRYNGELIITATGESNTISIVQGDSGLTVTLNGQDYSLALPSSGIFVYTRSGNESITIDSTVTTRTTVEAIDSSATTISSAGTNVSVWMDSTDTFSGSGIVHRIASFVGGISTAVGKYLANPTDAGTTRKASASLWGTGPVMGDVNQGSVGDCYFLASVAAFAGQSPARLQESAVDFGDGTYVVQFIRNGTPSYYRISNDFTTGGFTGGYAYAHPGTSGTIWAMVLEKAFTYFRYGKNTYASINGGWMSEVYTDFGITSTDAYPKSTTDAALYNLISAALASGKPVTAATVDAPANLVGDHAYTIVSVSRDSSGVAHYVVRNPWGVSGTKSESSTGYATLTFAQLQTNFYNLTLATA